MMVDVACFCGCLYSFDGGAGACPRCGEVATVTGAAASAGTELSALPVRAFRELRRNGSFREGGRDLASDLLVGMADPLGRNPRTGETELRTGRRYIPGQSQASCHPLMTTYFVFVPSPREDGMTTTTGTAEMREADAGVGEKPPAIAMTEMLLGHLWLGRTLHTRDPAQLPRRHT